MEENIAEAIVGYLSTRESSLIKVWNIFVKKNQSCFRDACSIPKLCLFALLVLYEPSEIGLCRTGHFGGGFRAIENLS
jgi:hypothetical protein